MSIMGKQAGLHMLHHSVSFEAMHDSAENDAQPKCHPETHAKMLEKLYKWCIGSEWLDASERGSEDSEWESENSERESDDSDQESAVEQESEDSERELEDLHAELDTTVLPEGHPVLWLYGPAGAGKSAVMRTLAERLVTSDQLRGSFFFKRGHPTCGNAQKLFATLAYQLAFNIPQLKARISNVMADIPHVVTKSMDVQLQKLVIEPCKQLDTSPPITIIIDGLDECSDLGVQQEVLHCIGHSIHAQDSCPVQFLIASRPESHLREVFQGSLFHEIHNSFNVDQSFEDVRMYLEDEFARIH
ncbi:hypothetical protein C8J57DRAFT_758817 [Mycena rebaudengoi]|nr:hypothetical protein C8J57DRAFT_758817 [Mycena rebaudengoi]